MSKRDYYEVLGVSRDATEAELKKAYRRHAMKHHPDRNQDDEHAEGRFKEAKEAYEILGDSQKRAAYDQFGHAGVDGSAGGGFNAGDAFSDIFGDVFGDIFGGGRRSRTRGFKGADLRYELDLDLEQAAAGDEVTISYPHMVDCDSCEGSGAAPGSSQVQCDTCGGHGAVRVQQAFFSVQQTCPRCNGSGTMVKDPCATCHGEGRKRETHKLSVKVPAGVDSGDRIRLSGEGEVGRDGGPAGDLYVEINVRSHQIFQRDGSNLHCDIPISFATAVLGGSVEVPSLGGQIELKIPAETQSGRVFRLRGKGVKPVRGGPNGDLLVRIAIETPVRLSREQKKLVRELDESMQGSSISHHPREHGWLHGVKAFFERLG
jgi:molecular chaperone DnaJ